MDTSFLEIFFRIIAIGCFILGLLVNYGGKYVPEIALRLLRYGRANNCCKETTGEPGPRHTSSLLKFEVPKSWFGHFYLFAFICQSIIVLTVLNTSGVVTSFGFGTDFANSAGSVLTNVLQFLGGDAAGQQAVVNASTTVLVTSLFWVQIARRLYETWFVCIYSGTKMNIFHYGLAFVHYAGAMLSMISRSPGFGRPHIRDVGVCTVCPNELSIWSVIGVLLYMYGSYEQNQAHRVLANLRLGKNKQLKSLAHRIPTGGLFDHISSPNYWGEIVIYVAFMIMMEFQNSAWNSVTAWVVSNQIIGGITNRIWYLKTFPDYPKNRKAVIPFIW